jgi:hypothetical protein
MNTSLSADEVKMGYFLNSWRTKSAHLLAKALVCRLLASEPKRGCYVTERCVAPLDILRTTLKFDCVRSVISKKSEYLLGYGRAFFMVTAPRKKRGHPLICFFSQ